jgi:hypothetical protein
MANGDINGRHLTVNENTPQAAIATVAESGDRRSAEQARMNPPLCPVFRGPGVHTSNQASLNVMGDLVRCRRTVGLIHLEVA